MNPEVITQAIRKIVEEWTPTWAAIPKGLEDRDKDSTRSLHYVIAMASCETSVEMTANSVEEMTAGFCGRW